MKVVLAEKPSVARDIANVIGAKQKKDGYFEGNGFAVTYAFGHLVSHAEPETMNEAWGKPWRLNQLPMIPTQWKYIVEPKTRNQFNVIKNLFARQDAESIICATDAGREGEYIFRLIYMLTGSKKPVERLWISSLTADAIRSGMKKLKPSSEFDSLAAAAMARSRADWIVGLNFTRAYTIINRQLCTIGRVQTPTLALIVERQKAIDAFNIEKFFEILAQFAQGFKAKYFSPDKKENQTRIADKASADAIVQSVSSVGSGKVESVETSAKRANPPGLYDLLTLQKDANKRFGYTAQKTLNIAQSLYETHKVLSYPRTESRYLSTDIVPELPGVLSAVLKSHTTSSIAKEALKKQSIIAGKIDSKTLDKFLNKSYVNDSKLTDHHAIIPTNKTPPASLNDDEKNVYQLVATRFMSVFLPPEIKEETVAIINLGGHLFKAQGVVIKDPGWTVIDPKSESKAKKKGKGKGEETQVLPPLQKDQEVEKEKIEVKQGKTTPPKPYDDATLLSAMKNAGRELDDEDLASYMKQKGLGTPATRAAIIERLLQTGYITRDKKQLNPTAKGIALIDQVQNDLKDIALTANWEQQLADMQDEKISRRAFEGDIASFVKNILPSVVENTRPLARQPGSYKNGNGNGAAGGEAKAGKDGKFPEGTIAPCPQCKDGLVRKTPNGAGCSRWQEGCRFSVWREVYGKKLTDNQIAELVKKGETKVIKGFKKKSGKGTYDARLHINDEFKVRLKFEEFEPVTFGPCPKCKKAGQEGIVRQTPKGAGCSRWKEGCTFSVWREVFGKTLEDEVIKALVVKKESDLVKGFKKKSGDGTYDAYLVLNDEFKVRLRFTGEKPAPASSLSDSSDSRAN